MAFGLVSIQWVHHIKLSPANRGYAGMQADLQALTSWANTYLAMHLCKPDDLFKNLENRW